MERGIGITRNFVQRVRQHPRSYYDLQPEQLVTVADSVRLGAKKMPDAIGIGQNFVCAWIGINSSGYCLFKSVKHLNDN